MSECRTTHYAGCDCHEAARNAEIARWRAVANELAGALYRHAFGTGNASQLDRDTTAALARFDAMDKEVERG